MPGVQQVEAAAGGDHRAAGRRAPGATTPAARPRPSVEGSAASDASPDAADPSANGRPAGGDVRRRGRHGGLDRLGHQGARGQRQRRRRGEPVPGPARSSTVLGAYGDGTTSGVGPAWQSIAPSAPVVTATARARQRCRSRWPARCAAVSATAAGVAGQRRAPRPRSASTSRAPGTAAGPRGCGSHTTGADAPPSAARSAGCAGHPAAVVADQDRRRRPRARPSTASDGAPGVAARPPRSSRSSTCPPARSRIFSGVAPAQRQRVDLDAGRGEQRAQPRAAVVVGQRGDQRHLGAAARRRAARPARRRRAGRAADVSSSTGTGASGAIRVHGALDVAVEQASPTTTSRPLTTPPAIHAPRQTEGS